MLLYDRLKNDDQVRTYITKADESLSAIGYTEHAFAHVTRVSEGAKKILQTLGYDEHTVDLAMSAGYIHDIGNLANRVGHSQTGAMMAFFILQKYDIPADDISVIITAIGNHDEGTGVPVDPVSAALILADKSDVRRSRVRNQDITSFDIHDRVNYSVTSSNINIDRETSRIILELTIDTDISSVMDYFEIFLERMILCRKAAEKLGQSFKLVINKQTLL